MNKIGIHYGYWVNDWCKDYIPFVKKASDAGFDILEINTASFLDMTQSETDDLLDEAKRYNIKLTYSEGLAPQYDVASENLSIRRAGIEHCKRTMEKVAKMGGDIYCGVLYSAWGSMPSVGLYNKDKVVERSIESVREMGITAKNLGLKFSMEAVNRFEQYIMNTSKEARDFVERVDDGATSILLDTFHMNIEEDSIVDAILTAGNRLGHLHVGEQSRRPPLAGRMPWNDIFDVLKQIDYQGDIVIESFVRMGGEVGRDIKIWRDIIEPNTEEHLERELRNSLEFLKGMV